jgi:dynamin 1-like protein
MTDENDVIDKNIHSNKVIDTIWNIGSAIGSAYQNINPNNKLNTFSYKNNFGLDKLTSNQIIQVGDYLQDIFNHFDLDSEEMKKRKKLLNPPRICVIGSQSSGKSITLNGILGIDILPNGSSIVTRTPIHLRLIHTNTNHIEINFYENNKIISSHELPINYDKDLLQPIQDDISKLTIKYAGTSKNVVDKPIEIKVKSPMVPNLSIIDLPGLTNIALTDKGQPDNIKENIKSMLVKYISNPRTIMLSIIPATIDVESDMGLGLIKKYDPSFERTIGVITKIDLLKDSNVIKYLKNKISKDLQLCYGYFAVRNRSSKEIETCNTIDGYKLENEFFSNTNPYNSKENENIQNRMGVVKLGGILSEILISKLKECLPDVINQINILDEQIELQLDEIGRDYPNTDSQKRNVLNVLLNDFQRIYSSSVSDRGSKYNTGAEIARSYNLFKSKMNDIKPFDDTIYTDNIIINMIENYEGNHMPSITISTGVIEKCFQGNIEIDGKSLEPLDNMYLPYIELINSIKKTLIDLVENILDREKYSRFTNLVNDLKKIVFTEIIPSRYSDVQNRIKDLFHMEKECIWTDDKEFRNKILPKLFSKDNVLEEDTFNPENPKMIRIVLDGYYQIINEKMKHNIHKVIQTFFVNKIVYDINLKLNDKLLIKTNIRKLLEENKDKAVKREKLLFLKDKIEKSLEMIHSMD